MLHKRPFGSASYTLAGDAGRGGLSFGWDSGWTRGDGRDRVYARQTVREPVRNHTRRAPLAAAFLRRAASGRTAVAARAVFPDLLPGDHAHQPGGDRLSLRCAGDLRRGGQPVRAASRDLGATVLLRRLRAPVPGVLRSCSRTLLRERAPPARLRLPHRGARPTGFEGHPASLVLRRRSAGRPWLDPHRRLSGRALLLLPLHDRAQAGAWDLDQEDAGSHPDPPGALPYPGGIRDVPRLQGRARRGSNIRHSVVNPWKLPILRAGRAPGSRSTNPLAGSRTQP